MTEPTPDGIDIDARTEEVCCGAVATMLSAT